jgi:hypothetical protein
MRLRLAHFAIAWALFAGPALAAEAGLPQAFQGIWVAVGDCAETNDVPGGRIEVGAASLKSFGFACTLANVVEVPDEQNRRFSLLRHCTSDGRVSDAGMTLYHVQSDAFGEALVTMNENGSYLTLYKRCGE